MKRFKRATVLSAAARPAACSSGHTLGPEEGPEIQPDPQSMPQPHRGSRDLLDTSAQLNARGTQGKSSTVPNSSTATLPHWRDGHKPAPILWDTQQR